MIFSSFITLVLNIIKFSSAEVSYTPPHKFGFDWQDYIPVHKPLQPQIRRPPYSNNLNLDYWTSEEYPKWKITPEYKHTASYNHLENYPREPFPPVYWLKPTGPMPPLKKLVKANKKRPSMLYERTKDESYPIALNRRERRRNTTLADCKGRTHLINDFGIISLLIGAVSTVFGFSLDLFLTLKGNAVSILATLFGLVPSIPSALFTYFHISNPFFDTLSNGLNVLGISATLFGGGAALGIGNIVLITGVLFEILGIIGLVVSILSSFPELLDDFVDFGDLFGFGDELKDFIDNYGCRNPYYTEG